MRTAMSAGIVVLVTCLLLEASLRASDYSYYWSLSRAPDPILGYRPLPNIDAWQRQEGEARIRTNQAGWRTDSPSDPRDSIKVLVLGDSMTEAVQVATEDTYWYRLPAEVAERCPDRKITTQALASSGYGPGQFLAIAENDFLDTNPDWVIYTHFPGNDVMEAEPALVKDRLRPFPDPATGQTDQHFRQLPEFRHKQAWYGQIWLYLVKRLRSLQASVAVYHRLSLTDPSQEDMAFMLEPQVDGRAFMPPPSKDWASAWDRTLTAIAKTKTLAEASGAGFDLISLSTGLQVTHQSEIRQQALQMSRLPHLFYQENRLHRFSQNAGISYLALAPALRERAKNRQLDLHGFQNAVPGFGHWNPAGHHAAAKLIAAHLCRRLPSLDQ